MVTKIPTMVLIGGFLFLAAACTVQKGAVGAKIPVDLSTGTAVAETPPVFAAPPPAVMQIGELAQESGIGSYCWASPGPEPDICLDTLGIPTLGEPLVANAPFTARFVLAITDRPRTTQLTVHPVDADQSPTPDATGARNWPPNPGKTFHGPAQREPQFELDLEPGLYVLSLFVAWDDLGDVFYGFLVEVP